MDDDLSPRKGRVERKHLALGPLLLLAGTGTFYFISCYYYYSPGIARTSSSLRSAFTTVVAYREKDDNQPDCEIPLSACEDAEAEGVSGGWRKVVPDGSEWYVYSAYVDRRPDVPLVRIVAMSGGDSDAPLYCRWWFRAAGATKSVRAQKQGLWIRAWDSAKPGRYYHPFLLSCPVPETGHPAAVSVVRDPCARPLHRIRLDDHPANSSGDFVVCLKPLDFEEDISPRLLEWLELQYILGADRVHAYVYRLHPGTWKVLHNYEALGKLTWQNHTLPGNASGKRELWQKRRHEMAVYNDCFYRHVHSYRFVVNLDIDEAIVPVIRDSWKELLSDYHHPIPASLSVRNVYFFDSFGEVHDPDIPTHMRMLRHVVRSANFTPPGFAQKSFFSTRLAEVVSNHFALRAVTPDVRLLAGIDVGRVRLHHYRKTCPPLMKTDCERNYMKFRERDTLIWKFKDRLIRNVLYKIHELGLEGVAMQCRPHHPSTGWRNETNAA